MITTALAVSETKTFPSISGPGLTLVSVSLASGTDPGTCQVSCQDVMNPVDLQITDAGPVAKKYRMLGSDYSVANTGLVDLVLETPLPPNA